MMDRTIRAGSTVASSATSSEEKPVTAAVDLLRRTPEEVRAMIFDHSVDANSILETMSSMLSWRSVNKTMRSTALRFGHLKDPYEKLLIGLGGLEGITLKNIDHARETFKKPEYLCLYPAYAQGEIFDVSKANDHELHTAALAIDYLDNKIKTQVVEKARLEKTDVALIEKSDRLSPSDRKVLVEKTLQAPGSNAYLEAWAGRTGALSDDDQTRIVDFLISKNKPYHLGLFAKKLGDLSAGNSEKVATAILDLERTSGSYFWTLSQLTANVGQLDENASYKGGSLRAAVLSRALEHLPGPPTPGAVAQLNYHPSSPLPWFARQPVGEIELVYQLSLNKTLLDEDGQHKLDDVISRFEKSEDAISKAQLLPLLDLEKNHDFVKDALFERGPRTDAVAARLSLRADNMDEKNKDLYFEYISENVATSPALSAARRYLFSDKLQFFESAQVESLTKIRVYALKGSSHRQVTLKGMSEISNQSRHIGVKDVLNVISAVKNGSLERTLSTNEHAYLRAFAAISAANWAREAFYKPARAIAASVVHDVNPQLSRSKAEEVNTSRRGSYDDRSATLSVVR